MAETVNSLTIRVQIVGSVAGDNGVRQPIATLILSNTARSDLTAFLKTLAREVAADGVTVNGAKVITADVLTSNGVIHAIDAVILPPDVDVDALLAQ